MKNVFKFLSWRRNLEISSEESKEHAFPADYLGSLNVAQARNVTHVMDILALRHRASGGFNSKRCKLVLNASHLVIKYQNRDLQDSVFLIGRMTRCQCASMVTSYDDHQRYLPLDLSSGGDSSDDDTNNVTDKNLLPDDSEFQLSLKSQETSSKSNDESKLSQSTKGLQAEYTNTVKIGTTNTTNQHSKHRELLVSWICRQSTKNGRVVYQGHTVSLNTQREAEDLAQKISSRIKSNLLEYRRAIDRRAACRQRLTNVSEERCGEPPLRWTFYYSAAMRRYRGHGSIPENNCESNYSSQRRSQVVVSQSHGGKRIWRKANADQAESNNSVRQGHISRQRRHSSHDRGKVQKNGMALPAPSIRRLNTLTESREEEVEGDDGSDEEYVSIGTTMSLECSSTTKGYDSSSSCDKRKLDNNSAADVGEKKNSSAFYSRHTRCRSRVLLKFK